MADTAAIVRLMNHAADRLAEETIDDLLPSGASAERHERVTSVAVAMAYAAGILRTVAATITETEG